MSDTDTICESEVDIVDNIAKFGESWRFLCVADVGTDPVCRRLDKLIKNGNISKDQIFYKYLDNLTQIIMIQNTHMTKTWLSFLLLLYTTAAKVRITLFVGRYFLVTDKVIQTKFAWTWVDLESRLLGKKFLISFYYLQSIIYSNLNSFLEMYQQ